MFRLKFEIASQLRNEILLFDFSVTISLYFSLEDFWELSAKKGDISSIFDYQSGLALLKLHICWTLHPLLLQRKYLFI